MISSFRMIIALPFLFVGLCFNILSVYIGGEKFAELYLDAMKKAVRGA